MAKKDHGASRAQQQANAAQLQAQQAITTASQPTPLQQQLGQSDLDFLNASRSPTFDIRDPNLGLNPYLSLYDSAVANRDADKAGTGILRLGTNVQNPDIAASQERLNEERRREAAGGELENAYKLRSAEVTGSAMPLINLDTSRNLSLAGMQNQSAQNDWARYFQLRAMPTWWEQVRNGFAQGAGAGLSMGGG